MKFTAIALGTVRTVTKFLWLPVTIDGITRWLEWATIQQIRTGCLSPECYTEIWHNDKFID